MDKYAGMILSAALETVIMKSPSVVVLPVNISVVTGPSADVKDTSVVAGPSMDVENLVWGPGWGKMLVLTD